MKGIEENWSKAVRFSYTQIMKLIRNYKIIFQIKDNQYSFRRFDF